ncbi:molybdenum cofactor biosynthesis protein MoaE [SAR202 cluster bacterium AD-802-E10_MRT_200m]|nr:molybdenum cofactor biosynthesis protein MoaE [SAR202 cluster bacterium AD-802-E10_MRT_200m]
MNHYVVITNRALEVGSVISRVKARYNGGLVTFMGITRDETDGRSVRFLEYEAYDSMAEKVIRQILEESHELWNITDAAVEHRIGHVDIGELSLVVAVAAPHRKEAFAACGFIVDRIKEIVPIWKKEYFVDGSVWVGCGNEQVHPTAVHGSEV